MKLKFMLRPITIRQFEDQICPVIAIKSSIIHEKYRLGLGMNRYAWNMWHKPDVIIWARYPPEGWSDQEWASNFAEYKLKRVG